MIHWQWVRFAAISCVLLAGCDIGRGPAGVETLSGSNVVRHHSPQQVALGEQVFKQHCAVCHGANGEGAPTWRQRDAEGFFPPPPLNGSGHEWHHPAVTLRDMIRDGSPPGQGKMPAWGGTLSEPEIAAVVEWFQSRWPDPVYAAWYAMQQRSQGR